MVKKPHKATPKNNRKQEFFHYILIYKFICNARKAIRESGGLVGEKGILFTQSGKITRYPEGSIHCIATFSIQNVIFKLIFS
jgi:hypothetical protein